MKNFVTKKEIIEAITQEVYLQVGFKTCVCVLILNTGEEVIGSYSPLLDTELDIEKGKKKARDGALIKAYKHLKSIAQWKNAVEAVREARAREEAQAEAEKEGGTGAISGDDKKV